MGKRTVRSTKEDFIAEATARHGDRYDYTKVVYVTRRTKVEIICRDHGSFMQEPANHKNGSGCPACSGNKRTTLADFIARAKSAHGGRYDYSNSNYTGVDNKVTIVCPEHGEFEQIAYDHVKGHGCARCGSAQAVDKRRHDLSRFVKEAKALHGDRFDYGKAVYINSVTPIEIVCPDHGSFWQVPHDHKTRYGCRACAGLAPIDAMSFLSAAAAMHHGRYNYSLSTYTGFRNPVEIICDTHGAFLQIPKDHCSGSGCPQCAREATSSKGETELADWVASLGVRVVRNDRVTLSGIEIDIYLPDQKLAIEYNGSYWHADVNMKNKRIHEVKIARAEKLGIKLFSVWDFDWAGNRLVVEQHIKHLLGLSDRRKVHARKCDLVHLDYKSAAEFYNRTHIQGAPWRSMAHYALRDGDDVVACMSFGQGNSRRGRVGAAEWELTRYATAGLVRGGASRLMAAFVREHDPEVIWSYSDRQHFSGALYPVLGFSEDGRLPADYRVVHQGRKKVWHKSAWKRTCIPKRLAEIGSSIKYDPDADPRTEREMQDLARAIRIYDAGKIRWKWTKKGA